MLLPKLKVYFYHWASLVPFLILNVIRFLFYLFYQSIFWRFNGVKQHLDLVYNEENEDALLYNDQLYNRSAHVQKILWACKASPFDKIRRSFFLTLHNTFTNPSIVLGDDVILVGVKSKQAIFVRLENRLDQYTVTKAPFLFLTCVQKARELIEMPFWALEHLAREIGDPKYEKICFMINSGRCGSTAVAKMIDEADPENTLVLSEPSVLMDFVTCRKFTTNDQYFKMLKATLHLLCKPMCQKTKLVIKPTYFVCSIAQELQHVMPEASFIYCHRNPLQTCISHAKAFGCSPLYRFLQLMLITNAWEWAEKTLGCIGNYENLPSVNKYLKSTLFETCVVIWADNYARYRNHAKQFNFPAIYYDDLLENPQNFVQKMLEIFFISQEKFPQALAALESDAQKGTCLSIDFLKSRRKNEHYTDDVEMRNRIDAFCSALDLPQFKWDHLEKSSGSKLSINNKNNFLQNEMRVKKYSSQRAVYKPLPFQCMVSGSD